MAAPAVPSERPGTTVDPAAITVEPVSALHSANPSSAEIPKHVGQSNKPDDYIYQHYIELATFTWNTSQLPGTLLYSVPIHWSQYNPVIQQLCSIYNAHCSDADFAVKIAGTGFHAGGVVFCRIPPNIDPVTITSPSQFTIFEWELIDPKKLEFEGLDLMDQRNVMFHYNPLDLANPQSFGGFFAIYVALQLATSSSGNQQVSVMVLNKLNRRAAFSQPRPLLTSSNAPTFTSYEEIMPDYPTFLTTSDSIGAVYMTALAATTVVSSYYQAVQCQLNGVSYTGCEYCPVHNNLISLQHADVPGGIIWGNPWCDQLQKYGAYNFNASELARIQCSTPSMLVAPFANVPQGVSQTNGGSGSTFATVATNITATTITPVYVGSVDRDFILNTPPTQTVLGGETVLVFSFLPWTSGQTADGRTSTQTDMMIYVLRKLAPSYSWTTNSALLFTLVHRDTELPVAFVKLNFDGLLTTGATTSNIVYRVADFKLSFVGVINRTTPIPVNTIAMRQNYMTLRASKGVEHYAKELETVRAKVAAFERAGAVPSGSRL